VERMISDMRHLRRINTGDGVEPETDRELRETGNDNETHRKLNRLETRKPE